MKFDDFIQCCVMLKTLTDAFRKHDTTQTGVVQINYEQVSLVYDVVKAKIATIITKFTKIDSSKMVKCLQCNVKDGRQFIAPAFTVHRIERYIKVWNDNWRLFGCHLWSRTVDQCQSLFIVFVGAIINCEDKNNRNGLALFLQFGIKDGDRVLRRALLFIKGNAMFYLWYGL